MVIFCCNRAKPRPFPLISSKLLRSLLRQLAVALWTLLVAACYVELLLCRTALKTNMLMSSWPSSAISKPFNALFNLVVKKMVDKSFGKHFCLRAWSMFSQARNLWKTSSMRKNPMPRQMHTFSESLPTLLNSPLRGKKARCIETSAFCGCCLWSNLLPQRVLQRREKEGCLLWLEKKIEGK